MNGVGVLETACRPGQGELRKFSRIPVVIPVRIEVFPSPPVSGFAAFPGTLLNIGRGGGQVRLRWEFPPQARLVVSLPVSMPALRLTADVIWVRHSFDRGSKPALYGVRWTEPLSSGALESILKRQGLTAMGEKSPAPGFWNRPPA